MYHSRRFDTPKRPKWPRRSSAREFRSVAGRKINPHLFYALLAMVLVAAAGAALWWYTAMHPLWIYLTALTLVTFAFYGFDKHQAIRGRGRVPEAILHLLALAGGSLGALAGQILFRHKIRKLYFTAILAMIMAVQIGCIAWWIYRTRAPG